MDVVAVIRDLGFPVALVLLLLYHLRSEYTRVTARLTQTEDWVRETLVKALNRSTDVMADVARMSREGMAVLAQRPCMHDEQPPNSGDYKPHPSSVRDIHPVRTFDTTEEIKR